MVLAQFLLAILFLAAPFIAIFALIPEGGWNIGIKYVKLVLGGFGVKVFYGVYLSLVMTTAEAAQNVVQGGIGGPIMIDVFIFTAALFLRKRIIEIMREAVVSGAARIGLNEEAIINRERSRAGGTAKRWLAGAAAYRFMTRRTGKSPGGKEKAREKPKAEGGGEGFDGAMRDFRNSEVLSHYRENFRRRYGYEPVMSDRDRQVVSKLTESYSPEDLNRRMDRWFAHRDNPGIYGKGDLETFARNIKAFGPPRIRQVNSLKLVRGRGLRQKPRPTPMEVRNGEVIRHYEERFEVLFGNKPVVKDRDRESLCQIPLHYSSGEVNRLVDGWIENSDKFEFGSGDISSFTRHFNKVVALQAQHGASQDGRQNSSGRQKIHLRQGREG
jgi:hypothetical protein